ncbi:hypothetical protein DFH27DRAFT_72547 [Peziza echinospora]|nr:hypothetical protein DFH27DRAFT_72547 [Peziza echinospora]
MSSGHQLFNNASAPMYFSGDQDYQHRSHTSPSGSPASTGDADGLDDAARNAKRTPKACDRCRHKKTKCTGESPCQRCRLDNTVCAYTNRRPKEGPNFNPQVAQKDAAMSMLYKCIEVMNHKLMVARLGPYADPATASYAESEEFIIGVILDRFGVSPVLDEFDNMPVYLPGQRNFNPDNCAVEFPIYTSTYMGSSMFDDDSLSKPQAVFGSPANLPRSLPGYSDDREDQRPRTKKKRACSDDVSLTPELDRSYGYESSPDLYVPKTPGRHATIIAMECQLDYRSLAANTPPPNRQQSYTYEGQQQRPVQTFQQLDMGELEQPAQWNSQKLYEDASVMIPSLLPGDLMDPINQFDNSRRMANTSAQFQQPTPHNSFHIQQTQLERLRRDGQRGRHPHPRSRQSSPAPSSYTSGINKPPIPLPAHIAQAAEMDPSSTQWDYSTSVSSAGLPSYPSSLCSSGVSPEISSMRLVGGQRHSPNLRGNATPEPIIFGDARRGDFMEMGGVGHW